MERIGQILKHPVYHMHMEAIEKAEEQRVFCRHNMSHFLDVARIARILNDEEHMGISKEWIYAAALLHDIGRDEEYRSGIPHQQASGEIAPQILKECGFNDNETDVIVNAICCHRDKSVAALRNLSGLIYRADKASRPCFFCPAEKECHWGKEKKNLNLLY